MKKSILIVLLIALLAVAVGVSGCLGGDDANNTTNNTTNNTSNNSTNNSTNNTSNNSTNNTTNNTTNATPNATFNNSTVTITSLPSGYELLAVKNVTADKENIDGVTDALNGYSGSYAVNNTNVYLSAFQAANNSSAQGYVQSMIDAHNAKYPNSSNVTNVTVNSHNATLITTNVMSGGTTVERYTLAWASGDKLVVVNGPGTYDQIKTIADASKL